MRIDRQSEQAVEDFEPAAAPAAQSPTPSAAQQAALDQAGVTSASGFAEPAAAPVAAPPAAATPAADAPTVRASQLQNGTASLDTAAAAAPVVLYAAPTDTGNLAKIMSGADGQVPLTRDQVVQTVTTAFPESASLIAAGVTDDSLAQAFSSVISAHATAGTKDVSINLVGFESHTEDVPSGEYTVPTTLTTPSSTPTAFKASLAVGADGKVNGQTLSVDAAELADLKPYPDGNSAEHIKLKYDVVGDPGNLANLMAAHGDQPALPRQAIVDTVVAAMPAAKALIAAGVTDDSLARAFSQVIAARNTPGDKNLSLDLVPLITTTTESPAWGEYTPPPVTTVTPADHPTTLTGKISVGEDGKVNGARLPADFATTIISASRSVPQEFKDATLKEVGLSDEWLQNASQEQKDYALAKIIDAKSTPGDKSLDLSYPYDAVQNWGENATTVHTVAAGNISFKAGPGGLVNGKPLTAEVAFSATQAVEAMPLAVRRGSLQTLGFPADAISKASADQQKYALIKTRVSTATPGTTQFEVHMGGDKYAVGLKISADHKIEGAGVQFIPPPPKKSWWKSVVSIVCTVVSIVFPVAAPICMAINAGIAISNGAKGLGLIAAVAGAAAGIADISGFASMAQTLSTAATTIGSVNSAINAFQHGDFLGALSSAVSAGAGMAGGFSELGSLGETLQTVSTVARAGSGLIGALKTGDPLALLSAGANAAGAFGKALDFDVPDSLATIGRVASTARAFQNGDYIGALNGISGLTGNFKNVDQLTGAANSIATGFNNAVNTFGTTALPSLVGPPDESTLVPFTDAAITTVNAVNDATAAFVGPPGPDADTTALTSVLSLTGNDDDGDVIATGPAQTGSQSDVRRVDNAIDAAGPQLSIRERFNQAFAAAKSTGQRTFSYDAGDGRGSQQYTTGTRQENAAALPNGSGADYASFVRQNYSGRDSDAAYEAYRLSKIPPPAAQQTSIPSVAFNDAGGAQEGSFSAGAVNTGRRFTTDPAAESDDDSYLGILGQRISTIGTNIKTAVTSTTVDGVVSAAKGAYNGAVDATSRGIEYLATTTAEQRRADTAAALGKAYDAVVADPLGATAAAINTVIPVKSLYENVEKLGDRELSAADARRAFYGAVADTVGVVAVGAAGSALKGGRVAAEVDAAVDAGLEAGARGGRAVVGEVVDGGAGTGRAGSVASDLEGARAPVVERPVVDVPPVKVTAPPLETERVMSADFRGSQYYDMTAKNAAGQEVGKVSYIVDTKAGTLEVTGLDVVPEMQGQGVSGQLFAKVLEENPGITAIKASTLQDTNMAVYVRVYNETGDMEAAIRATPAYKIRAAAGFTELEIIDPMATGSPGFIMRRPAGAAVEAAVTDAATVAAVVQPAERTAEELARANAALARTEPPPGHYSPLAPEIGGYHRAETLTPTQRAGYEGISSYMYDPARPIARTQELERAVQRRVAETGVSTAEALEAELSAAEAKAGFKPALDLEPRPYTDTEWAKMLSDGALFRDVNFADSPHHGVQTHRVQWWGLVRDMELNPANYGGASAVELYQGIGTAQVGSGPAALWAKLFDTGIDYHPSFGGFYLANQDLFPGLAGGL